MSNTPHHTGTPTPPLPSTPSPPQPPTSNSTSTLPPLSPFPPPPPPPPPPPSRTPSQPPSQPTSQQDAMPPTPLPTCGTALPRVPFRTSPPDLPPIVIPPRPHIHLSGMFPDDPAYSITMPQSPSPTGSPPRSPQSSRAHPQLRPTSPTPSPRFPTAPLSAVSFTEYVTSEFVLHEESPRFTMSFKPISSASSQPTAATALPPSMPKPHEGDASSPSRSSASRQDVTPPSDIAPLQRSETLPNLLRDFATDTLDADPPPKFVPHPSATSTGRIDPFATADAHARWDGQVPARSRYGKLDILQVDEEGDVAQLSLTRAEILHEARSTRPDSHSASVMTDMQQHRVHTAWKDAPLSPWLDRRDATPAASPRLDSRRRAVQKALRDYLRNSLQARDIRQVDPAFVAKPALWVRHSAIVVSLEGLRAIILYNKMLLFDPIRTETKQLLQVSKKCILANPDADNPQPFEFNALEGILIFLAMRLEKEFDKLKPEIDMYVHQLPNELTTKMLEELRLKKQQLNDFHSRASNVKTILEHLLDEDEEMANMYLTEKHEGQHGVLRDCHDHSEIETLLEAYLQVIDEHVNHATLLHDAIEDTEDLVMIHLDTLRNRLLSVELTLSVVSMMFGVGGVISGIFGMNLKMPLFEDEANPAWFFVVVGTIIVLVVAVSWTLIASLRRRGLYSTN